MRLNRAKKNLNPTTTTTDTYDLNVPFSFTPAERKAITWGWCQHGQNFPLYNLMMFLMLEGMTPRRALDLLKMEDDKIVIAMEMLEKMVDKG